MPSSWRVRIGALGALGLALLGATCWDPILSLRSCPQIVIALGVGVPDFVPIPNCFGSGPLRTIPSRETWSIPNLPASLVADEVPNDRFTRRIRLKPTASAVAGTFEEFLLRFDGDAPQFDQIIGIHIDFTGTTNACVPAPIAAADACAELRASTVNWLRVCNPELSQADAEHFAEGLCIPEDRFTDPLVSYDAAKAGECACAIEGMDCLAGDPFRFIQSCAGVVTGTLANGQTCSADAPWQCASDGCSVNASACGGSCEPIVADGDACVDVNGFVLPCQPGSWCAADTNACEPLPVVGESCNFFGLCAGDFDPYLLPGAVCNADTFTCGEAGRAGAVCLGGESCQPFYACNESLFCELKPARGEACTGPVDTETPSHDDWVFAISGLNVACRVDFPTQPSGDFCAPTGTNPSVGVCTAVPGFGDACGLGNGLSPRCEEGRYCNGIDAGNLQTGDQGVCVPLLGADQLCDPFWNVELLGPQCAGGASCDLDLTNFVDYRCSATCS